MQKIKAVISEKLLAAYKETSKIVLNLFWCTQKTRTLVIKQPMKNIELSLEEHLERSKITSQKHFCFKI